MRRAVRRQIVGDLSLQIAHARFARVVADDGGERVLAQDELRLLQSVLGELSRHQILRRDVDLLLLGVAGQLDDFHAVAQRRWNRLEQVRRGDEHDARQIERDFEIMVGEAVVLLRVKHFQQRRTRVAAKIRADLVDFVEHEDRIVALGAAQSLDHAARQRADVRAAMAANLRLVAHAAE